MAVQGKIGFRINNEVDRSGLQLVNRYMDFATPNIADCMGRHGALHHSIKPIKDDTKMVGIACTVRLRPGDNLMLHKAVDIAQAGDVLVVDCEGHMKNAPWGELLTLAAMKKGIKGLVIDGVIRDVKDIRALGFPIFCKGMTPNGCDKDGPGEVNLPISCGGVIVNPGDIVVGDDDGVVIIPRASASMIADATAAKIESEKKRREEIERGVIVRPEIDEGLRRKGIL